MITEKIITIKGLSEYSSSSYLSSDYIQKWMKLQPVPVLPIPPTSIYEGMSLEEIKDKYGEEEAQKVYSYCTQGIDLTVPSRIPPSPLFDDALDVVNWEIYIEFNERHFQYGCTVKVLPTPHRKTNSPIRALSREFMTAEAFDDLGLKLFTEFVLSRVGLGTIVKASYEIKETGEF